MSIVVNGQTLDITYSSGISSDFTEQPGAVIEVDPWGMDNITRRYTGRLDKVETELAKYQAKRNFPDPIYPAMYAVNWRMVLDAPLPGFEVRFRGVKDGKPRDPEIVSNRRVQTVTLQFVDSNGDKDGTTTTLKYYSPTITARYATKTRQTQAKYKNKVDVAGIEVISMTGDDERAIAYKRGPSINGATSSGTVLAALANSYNAMVELTGTVESKPVGQWYENTETCEAILVPLGLTQAKRIARI